MKQKSAKTQAAKMAAVGISLLAEGGPTFRGQLSARKKALRSCRKMNFSPGIVMAIVEQHVIAINKLNLLIFDNIKNTKK